MEDDFCWDVKSPELLNVVLNQKSRLICWAISFVRHLESVYRLEGKLVRLSVQELLNIIPRTLINRNKGNLIAPLDVFTEYVKNNGTVAESDCPFTGVVHRLSRAPTENVPRYRLSKVDIVSYNDHDTEAFEDFLRQALQNSPVTARIIIANGYDSIEGDAIYKPNEADEDVADYGFGHMLLIIGCRIDEHGQRYWIAQDSFGSGQGQDGIIRIARFDDIVTDFFVISVDVDE